MELLSGEQVAEGLGLSVRRIPEIRRARLVRAMKPGRTWLYDAGSVAALRERLMDGDDLRELVAQARDEEEAA